MATVLGRGGSAVQMGRCEIKRRLGLRQDDRQRPKVQVMAFREAGNAKRECGRLFVDLEVPPQAVGDVSASVLLVRDHPRRLAKR
jgi:hypothetical protein